MSGFRKNVAVLICGMQHGMGPAGQLAEREKVRENIKTIVIMPTCESVTAVITHANPSLYSIE